MTRASVASLCLVLSCFASKPACGDAAPSGLSGRISSQSYSTSLGTLFVGEVDGYIDAYDPAAGRVVARSRLAPSPIVLIVCHPEKNELCAVASDGISGHAAFFLKYGNGSFVEIKRELLSEKPESICYSPKGGLIVIADRSSRGIILKETVEYATVEGFSADCGPTSFAAIGSSEKSLLQYAPQGRLVYRSLPDGAILQESKTLPNLVSSCLSGDKKSLYAMSRGDLVSVDSQSGRINYTLATKNLCAFSPPDAKGICLLALEDGKYRDIDLSTPKVPAVFSTSASPFVSIMRTENGGYTVLDRSGVVFLSRLEGGFAVLPLDPYYDVRLAVPFVDEAEPGYLFAGSVDAMFISEKDLLASAADGEPKARLLKTPLTGATALSAFGSSLYAASASPKPELRFVNGLSGEAIKISLDTASAVTRMSRSVFATLAIQANGTLSRLTAGSAKRLISVNGILDAAAISGNRIAIGKARGGSLAAPLLFYSISTGELSPVPIDAIAVLRVIPVAEERFLLLTVENGANGVVTAIRELRASPLSNKLIMSVPGERSDARLACRDDGTIFYSFGDQARAYRIDPSSATQAQEYELGDLPVFLCAGSTSLCVLHEDGSFSVIGLENGKTGRFAIGTGPRVYRLE
jgi:hypothetical protein